MKPAWLKKVIEKREILRSGSPRAFDRYTQHLIGTPLDASGGWQTTFFSRKKAVVGIPGDRDRPFRRIVTDDSGLS